MEKERQEQEEREREEEEAAMQLLELQNEVFKAKIAEKMREFGITRGFSLTRTGYLNGNGYLDMSWEDIHLAIKLEQRLNEDAILKENFQENLRCVKVRDKWFVAGKNRHSGKITILGLRDPDTVDQITGVPKNNALELQDTPE